MEDATPFTNFIPIYTSLELIAAGLLIRNLLTLIIITLKGVWNFSHFICSPPLRISNLPSTFVINLLVLTNLFWRISLYPTNLHISYSAKLSNNSSPISYFRFQSFSQSYFRPATTTFSLIFFFTQHQCTCFDIT